MFFEFIYNFTKFEILIEFKFFVQKTLGNVAVYDVIKKIEVIKFIEGRYLLKNLPVQSENSSRIVA